MRYATLLVTFLLVAAGVLGGATTVRAASSIYYSPVENVFGWCAGYAVDRANSCARSNCAKFGGSQCQPALTCSGGWGAVALAQSPAVGVGASCGRASPFAARTVAIASCVVEAKSLCWTSTIFDGNGTETAKSRLATDDTIWYAQAILQVRNYDVPSIDGTLSPQTLRAVQKFQTDIGRPAGSALDDYTFARLQDAAQGGSGIARFLKRDIVDPRRQDWRDTSFASAPTPAPQRTFSEEMQTWPVRDLRLALATILSTSGTKCTLPAADARIFFGEPSEEVWIVDCVEGSYRLSLLPTGQLIVSLASTTP